MIKELFHWIWELVKDLFTFKWKYLVYDIQNLYWYLIYGFTYSDIQDMDKYIGKRIAKMLEKFNSNTVEFVINTQNDKSIKDLREMQHLAELMWTQEFEDLKLETQEHLQNRFQNLLKKYFFHLWF